jgi:hypothetical protein
LNSLGLTILLHPNTDDPRADHLDFTLWLNRSQPVNAYGMKKPSPGQPRVAADLSEYEADGHAGSLMCSHAVSCRRALIIGHLDKPPLMYLEGKGIDSTSRPPIPQTFPQVGDKVISFISSQGKPSRNA